MKTTPILATLLLLATGFAHAQETSSATRISGGVHLISSHPDGNILVVESSNQLVLVDALGAKRSASADSALRTVSKKPVVMVVSTHYHEDHVGGNARWRERGAVVVAHRSVPSEALKDTTIAERSWHRTALPQAALPNMLFDDSAQLTLEGENFVVYHRQAHTRGDAVIWFPSRNVIHTGDIVEIGATPFVDWWAGGSLEGMISAVEFIHRITNEATIIVPGHGPPINRAVLRTYRSFLVAAGAACKANAPDAPQWACAPKPRGTP
jgi:glyoxylase-like metal-dependent hydrolase (beta-lactamase superfamily II)